MKTTLRRREFETRNDYMGRLFGRIGDYWGFDSFDSHIDHGVTRHPSNKYIGVDNNVDDRTSSNDDHDNGGRHDNYGKTKAEGVERC